MLAPRWPFPAKVSDRQSGRETWHMEAFTAELLYETSPAATMIMLAVDDSPLERLLTFHAGAEDLEDNGDAEPEDDAEAEGLLQVIDPPRRNSSPSVAVSNPAVRSPASQPT